MVAVEHPPLGAKHQQVRLTGKMEQAAPGVVYFRFVAHRHKFGKRFPPKQTRWPLVMLGNRRDDIPGHQTDRFELGPEAASRKPKVYTSFDRTCFVNGQLVPCRIARKGQIPDFS